MFVRTIFARPIPLFVRLTILVAAGLLALVLAAFLIKLIIIAAVIAAVGLGVLFLFNFFNAFSRIRRARIADRERGPIVR